MAVSRVKPGGWGLNEVVSSAQQTQIDTNIVAESTRLDTVSNKLNDISLGTEGVRKFRTFATYAALKASTDHVSGTYVLVRNKGFYVYDSSVDNFGGAIDSFQYQTPTDRIVAAAAGAWVHVLNGTDVPLGIPHLNSNGRLPAAMPINGIVHAGFGSLITAFSTTSGTYVNVTNGACGFTAAVGDWVKCHYDFDWQADRPTTTASFPTAKLIWSYESTPGGAYNLIGDATLEKKMWADGGSPTVALRVPGVSLTSRMYIGSLYGGTGNFRMQLQVAAVAGNFTAISAGSSDVLVTRPA